MKIIEFEKMPKIWFFSWLSGCIGERLYGLNRCLMYRTTHIPLNDARWRRAAAAPWFVPMNIGMCEILGNRCDAGNQRMSVPFFPLFIATFSFQLIEIYSNYQWISKKTPKKWRKWPTWQCKCLKFRKNRLFQSLEIWWNAENREKKMKYCVLLFHIKNIKCTNECTWFDKNA